MENIDTKEITDTDFENWLMNKTRVRFLELETLAFFTFDHNDLESPVTQERVQKHYKKTHFYSAENIQFITHK